jgi:hypothetical protein
MSTVNESANTLIQIDVVLEFSKIEAGKLVEFFDTDLLSYQIR